MSSRSVWKYLPPAGPVLSLLLIGIVLLSAVVYYRSVKIQRFLEPALALSQPRNIFAQKISNIFVTEFGKKQLPGIALRSTTIFVDKLHWYSPDGRLSDGAKSDLPKLARVFVSLMRDDHTRSEISMVTMIARVPSLGAKGSESAERLQVQRIIGHIQDSLFKAEPQLGINYSHYFVGAVQPVSPHEGNMNIIEFRIIPSEFLHIEVLDRLEKYTY